MILELLQNVYIQTFIKGVLLILVMVVPLAALLTLFERKWSALIQDRRGPGRANIGGFKLFGVMHIMADGLKLAFKEDSYPRNTDLLLYSLAPFFAFFSGVTIFATLPLTSSIGSFNFYLVDINIGILAILAFMSFGVYGAVLAGWSTDNKYGMLGSVRATAQMISYEVVIGLSLLGLLIVFGSFNILEIVAAQNTYFYGIIPRWGIVVQPVGFLLVFIAMLAEMKRAPFDAPEGESEIIAGYFIEYSGMRFGAFFVAEYIAIVATSALITTLYLGSYHIPFLFDHGFKLFSFELAMPEYLVAILRFGAFFVKVFFLCWFTQVVRWSLPRFRYDQILTLCWNRLLPLALLNLVISIVVVLFF